MRFINTKVIICFVLLLFALFILFLLFNNSVGKNYRKTVDNAEILDWEALEQRYGFKNYNVIDFRKFAEYERVNSDLSPDEKFFLNFKYFNGNFHTDPIEKIDFLIQSSLDQNLTIDARSFSIFCFDRVLFTYPDQESEIAEEIKKYEPYKSKLQNYNNSNDLKIEIAQISYDLYPMQENTTFLLFYLINRYESVSDLSKKEEIMKRIISIKYPIDLKMEFIFSNMENDRSGYKKLLLLWYLDASIKLTEDKILDKSKFIEKYISYLDILESSFLKNSDRSYFISNLYYTKILYFLMKADKKNITLYLTKLKNTKPDGEEPMSFVDMLKKGGTLEHDRTRLKI